MHNCPKCGRYWECDLPERYERAKPPEKWGYVHELCFFCQGMHIDADIPPKVWNKRDPKTPSDAVYVGRPSQWGNPYTHLPSKLDGVHQVATREEAVEKYRAMLMQKDTFWCVKRAEIQAHLRGKDLVCWCAPKSCHADTLLEIANGEREP